MSVRSEAEILAAEREAFQRCAAYYVESGGPVSRDGNLDRATWAAKLRTLRWVLGTDDVQLDD
jgi:hypothetical protein